MEKLILADGWILKSQIGSHRQYIHPTKKGKVTIPFHSKDLKKAMDLSILRQAGPKKSLTHNYIFRRLIYVIHLPSYLL